MEIDDTPRVIGELIENRARKLNNKIFLRFKDQKFTYNDMNHYSNQCANGLVKLGINKGDKVSIMLANCPEYIFLWFGLAKCGAVEVPINTAYKGGFLLHIVDQSDSRMVVIAYEFLDRLKMIENRLKKLEKVIVLGAPAGREIDILRIPTIGFNEMLGRGEGCVGVEVYPKDPISIIYTSGTTGLSKGALGSHNFWIIVAEKMLWYRDHRKEDIYLTFMPLYHFNAQVLTTLSLLIGEAEMLLCDKFSASRFWEEIRHCATQFNYLGAVMPILAKQPEKPDDLDKDTNRTCPKVSAETSWRYSGYMG